VLHQARRLLVGGLVEALLVQLDAQAARRFLGALLERLGSVCEVSFTSAR
jgi:hypothetical protein